MLMVNSFKVYKMKRSLLRKASVTKAIATVIFPRTYPHLFQTCPVSCHVI